MNYTLTAKILVNSMVVTETVTTKNPDFIDTHPITQTTPDSPDLVAINNTWLYVRRDGRVNIYPYSNVLSIAVTND